MKKLNLMKLLFSAMILFAGMAFTSCVDDNKDDGIPYIQVSPDVLNFSLEGVAEGTATFEVKTNRPWSLYIPEGENWITASKTQGKAGTSTVEIQIPANNDPRTVNLEFRLSNIYEVYERATVKINQGDVVEPELIYNETFGTTGNQTAVASYTGWEKTGQGSENVTYTSSGAVDIRSNLNSTGGYSAYEGSGGSNLMFGNDNTSFTVQNIELPEGMRTYSLSFGASYYSAPDIDIYDQLTIQLSKDGASWVDVPYGFKNFEPAMNWNLASVDFTLAQATEKLYIKFLSTKKPDGNYRIDDITLMTGNGGQLVDLNTGTEVWEVTPSAISLAAESGSTGTIQITTGNSWTANPTGSGFTLSSNSGTGSGTITVTASAANTTENEATLGTVVISDGNNSTTVNITQKGSVNALFFESFGNLDEALNPYPFIDAEEAQQYLDKEGYGWGASTTYEGNKASVRWAVNPSGAAATAGFSGLGHMWLAVPTASNSSTSFFTVKDLELTDETGINFSFGVLAGTADAVTTTTGVFKVAVSIDSGATWTDIGYTLSETLNGTSWKTASGAYNFPSAASSVSFRISYELESANSTNGLRIEDILLTPRRGGGTLPPTITTANYSALGETTVTVGGSISGADLNDYSAVGVEYVEWSTATPDWTGATKQAAATKATSWTINLTGLTAETQYAYRAYATPNSGDTVYADYKSFVTTDGSAASPISIPELLAISAGSYVSTSQDRELTAVVCGDPAGDNFSFGTLYLMTEGATTGGNGIVVYNNSSAQLDLTNYTLGDKLKITLQANVVQVAEYQGNKQLTGVTDDHIEKTGTATVTPIVVTPAQLSSYTAMPVTVQNATSPGSGTWTTGSTTTHTFSSGGTNFPVVVNGRAVPFQNTPFVSATGNLTGIATLYGGAGQVAPRNLDDVAAFSSAGTNPNITGVNPSSLSWTADETSAKTVTVSGNNLAGLTTSAPANFNVSVSGTTVTVTPKAANTGTTITETLTIYATGGNSTTVSLTHSGVSTGGEQVVEIDFSAQGWANQQKITTVTQGDITIQFSKASGATDPAYYNAGSALRVYAANTVTFSGATITKIEYTFVPDAGTDNYDNFTTVSTGTYSNATWTGSANNIEFISDPDRNSENKFVQTRIQKVKVTYQE